MRRLIFAVGLLPCLSAKQASDWKASTARLDFDSGIRRIIQEGFPKSVYAQYAFAEQFWEQIVRRSIRREKWLERIQRNPPDLAITGVQSDDEKPIEVSEVRDWSFTNSGNPLADDIWFQFAIGPFARENSADAVGTFLRELMQSFPGRTGALRAEAYLNWPEGYSFFSP